MPAEGGVGRSATRTAAALGAAYLTVGVARLVPWPEGEPLVVAVRVAAVLVASTRSSASGRGWSR